MLDDLFIQKGIFKNCIRVVKTEEGMLPLRFTGAQLEVYAKTDAQKLRSRCPAGVCMDFETDSSFVGFEYTIRGMARKWACFDIYVNGVFVEAAGNFSIERNTGEVYFEIPETGQKRNRLTIYLPQLVELTVRNIRLSGGAMMEAAGSCDRNLLCLGDSITQGMEAYHPSFSYPVLLARYLEMNLLNHGVGGYVYDPASLDPELPYEPDVITVAYGTNDWGRYGSLEEFKKNCSAYLAKLVQMYPRAQIHVLTPFWRKDLGEVKQTGSFFEIGAAIRAVSGALPQLNVIDGLALVPHMPEFFGDQYLHPNDAGFMYIALNLLKKLKTDR